MQRLDGLQKLATQSLRPKQEVPFDPNGTRSMSAADMQTLIRTSGMTPQQIADQVISGRGNLRGRMTVDALNVLQSNLLPKGQLSQADYTATMNRLNALHDLQPSMPAMAVEPSQLQIHGSGSGATLMDTLGATQSPQMRASTNAMTGATMWNGVGGMQQMRQRAPFIPSGDTALDMVRRMTYGPAHSPAEQAMLDQIQDPQQRAMQELQMFMQKQSLIATTLSNIANMRHEMLKTVANNLRA
jgi:hypothetical protein